MALVRLIYSSRKADGVDVPDLLRLLDKSTANNERDDITGLLYFTNNTFLQVLEEDVLPVNQLYRKIIIDMRHKEMNLIDYSFCIEREFPDWAMGFIELDATSIKKLCIGIQPIISIRELDSENALLLLKNSVQLCIDDLLILNETKIV